MRGGRNSPFAQQRKTGPCADAQQRLGAVMNALNLPDMPKGGLPFHLYAEGARTAFEEHMHEWRATLPHAEQPLVHFTLPKRAGLHGKPSCLNGRQK